MNERQARAVIDHLSRYREVKTSGKRKGMVLTRWDQDAGPFTSQALIPKVTKRQRLKMDAVMVNTKGRWAAIRWVDVDKLRSTQHCLKIKSLRWNLRHHKTMQRTFGTKKTHIDIRGVNLPIVCWVDGIPMIWNGNHRATVSILLGKKRILVRMFKRRR